jgi:hypothetical protein
MDKLNVDMLDADRAVVNVGEDGGYVMVETPKAGWVLITIVNDEGDVIFDREFNTVAHPEMAVNDER